MWTHTRRFELRHKLSSIWFTAWHKTSLLCLVPGRGNQSTIECVSSRAAKHLAIGRQRSKINLKCNNSWKKNPHKKKRTAHIVITIDMHRGTSSSSRAIKKRLLKKTKLSPISFALFPRNFTSLAQNWNYISFHSTRAGCDRSSLHGMQKKFLSFESNEKWHYKVCKQSHAALFACLITNTRSSYACISQSLSYQPHSLHHSKQQQKNKPSDDMRDKIDINIEGLLGKALKLWFHLFMIIETTERE